MMEPLPYSQVEAGYAWERRFTVTETHLLLASTLFHDVVPVHVDEEFAKRSMFGTRIAPGPLVSGFLAVTIGMQFAGTALAYLEQVDRYRGPVRLGDTITTRWKVVDKTDKPRFGGGIVTLAGICSNERGEVVLEATGKAIIGERRPDDDDDEEQT